MTLALDPSKVERVAALPRRTAHALHALIESSRDLKMPALAREVILYDGEAMTVRSTSAGLRHAQFLGLAVFTGRYWTPTNAALDLRYALEDRYLREAVEA